MESYRSMTKREFDLFSPPYSLKNSMAARCIKQEFKEMQSNPSDDFKCLSLTGNLYDWQFAIRGPNGTEFEGGIYHGRIQFPEEYPRKHSIFKLLTENGCFKTQVDISFLLFCLEPFTVQDALRRIIELLPTYPDGALGSVGCDKEKRLALAIKSREAPPKYGTAQRQKLINKIHNCMLSKAPLVPSNRGGDIWGWQFAIRCPNGTEFEGGIYHASIQFPKEYPRKRPIFKLLTKNGRFKTQTGIWFPWHTLNEEEDTHNQPEHKHIDLLPTYPDGALDSVGYDKEKRHALTIKSCEALPKYGTDQRQTLINEIHGCMLGKAPPPLLSNREGDIHVNSQNDLDKRKRGIYIISGNTIHANNSSRVGIWDFEKENVNQLVSNLLLCTFSSLFMTCGLLLTLKTMSLMH